MRASWGARSPTVSRELQRNATTRRWDLAYIASTAQWRADRAARRPKVAKLAAHPPLCHYVQELTACLRTGRALRVPAARTRSTGKHMVTPEVMISERPAEVEDRAVPGHWEGDLIMGSGSSAIGTLVERTTRFTLLLHLPRMAAHDAGARTSDTKNGPALAGHGARAARDAIARELGTLPVQLRQSLTWDRGVEMAQRARLRTDVGLAIYLCDPHSPWQRGTNESTNG